MTFDLVKNVYSFSLYYLINQYFFSIICRKTSVELKNNFFSFLGNLIFCVTFEVNMRCRVDLYFVENNFYCYHS